MIGRLQPTRLAVDAAAIMIYADLTNDHNPIHVDPDFARRSPLGGIIAHGTLSLNLLLDSIERTFGVPAEANDIEVRFRAPVRIGDVVEAGGERGENGRFHVWVRNQRGETVIEGEARIDAPDAA